MAKEYFFKYRTKCDKCTKKKTINFIDNMTWPYSSLANKFPKTAHWLPEAWFL